MQTKSLYLFLTTLISIILSYYISVLLHEYGHATMAWLLGYKTSPFDIIYGSWYLVPVSEAVDYKKIIASGHGVQAAFIGITGISVTIILFILSLTCLNTKPIQQHPLLFSFFFWLTSINLMEIFSYIPNRTFIMGDIGEFVQGLNISPLWIFLPGTLLVGLALYRFYRYEIVKLYHVMPIENRMMQRLILWLTFWPLILSIVYWEPPTDWKILSNTTNAVSLLCVIFILITCDPGRKKHSLCNHLNHPSG